MVFETVHTMTDWYDGPRRGVAIVNGRPHVYESCWSDIDSDDADLFVLSPVSDELLTTALEDWEIWLRWERACQAGLTTIESHPALPEDQERHKALESIFREQLVINEQTKIAATAVFRYNADKEPRIEAEWTIVEYVEARDKRELFRKRNYTPRPRAC